MIAARKIWLYRCARPIEPPPTLPELTERGGFFVFVCWFLCVFKLGTLSRALTDPVKVLFFLWTLHLSLEMVKTGGITSRHIRLLY